MLLISLHSSKECYVHWPVGAHFIIIAALATNEDRFERNGQVLTTAELALHYDIKDERDKQPRGKRNPSLFRETI